MMMFLVGAMVGAVVGVGTVCFLSVAAEEDRWMESADRKAKLDKMQEPRCPFCGGQLSEIRIHDDGEHNTIRRYRHCYSCHFDQYEL